MPLCAQIHQPIGSALKPLLLTIFTTSSSVTSPLTVRILSAFSVSTFQLDEPAAWSKSAWTLDTQPPQLRLVLNCKVLFSMIYLFNCFLLSFTMSACEGIGTGGFSNDSCPASLSLYLGHAPVCVLTDCLTQTYKWF